jgi:RNA polymerase sigma-70 factor, ECF subfamily
MNMEATLAAAPGRGGIADADRIETVYRQRHQEFLRVATAIAGNQEAGKDAVQEGLARAIAARRFFRGSGSLEAWLWRIVVNAARTARRTSAPAVEPWLDGAEAPAHDLPSETIRAAVAALPERQRLVLFLRYYGDLDYAAIASSLGIRRGTVSATLNHAHATLRRTLQEEDSR